MSRIELKLTLPGKLMREPIIYQISHDFDVRFTIRRGRFTEKSAWVDAELDGSQGKIRQVLEFLAEKGVEVKAEKKKR